MCPYCKRPASQKCEGGEMVYSDGSSRTCPNWDRFLEEAEQSEVSSRPNARTARQTFVFRHGYDSTRN